VDIDVLLDEFAARPFPAIADHGYTTGGCAAERVLGQFHWSSPSFAG
jgi:hypothetical protein